MGIAMAPKIVHVDAVVLAWWRLKLGIWRRFGCIHLNAEKRDHLGQKPNSISALNEQHRLWPCARAR